MDITIYGENRLTIPYVFVLYAVEVNSHSQHIEIFRQRFSFMPRYEHGDVIRFKRPGEQDIEDRYVVDRVVNYVVCIPQPPQQRGSTQYQNQVCVIMHPQPVIDGPDYEAYSVTKTNAFLHD
ncbi:hypothetical protein GCM10027592_15320 [Spirosoma flavus]